MPVTGSRIDEIEAADRLGVTGLVNHVDTGIISINAGDNSKFDITAGIIQLMDAYTDPDNPVLSMIKFGPFTAQTVDNIATDSASFIYIDDTGSIVQETLLQHGEFLRDHAQIGILTHPDNATITGISNFTPVSLSNTCMALADLSFAMGAVNAPSGDFNIITGNSGTLGLDKAQGEWYFFGINADTNRKDENFRLSVALVKPVMFIGWTVTDNVEGKLIIQDTISAGVFDDGTAVFADALPQGSLNNNQWVNNRVFHVTDSNQLAVQIGPVSYNSLASAKLGLASETFSTILVLRGTTPIATVSMRGGAADLSLIADAEIRQAIPPRATFQ